jgi:hypothetical protein
LNVTYSDTSSYTYSVVDIEKVMRRFSADVVMIAQSTAAITESAARDYAHDVELLAKYGYLHSVDLTLLSGSREVRATQYRVNTEAESLTTSRPGGVLWPRVDDAHLRITLTHSDDYDADAAAALKLRINWVPSSADTNHRGLSQAGGRDYASNGWGMQRKDYGV